MILILISKRYCQAEKGRRAGRLKGRPRVARLPGRAGAPLPQRAGRLNNDSWCCPSQKGRPRDTPDRQRRGGGPFCGAGPADACAGKAAQFDKKRPGKRRGIAQVAPQHMGARIAEPSGRARLWVLRTGPGNGGRHRSSASLASYVRPAHSGARPGGWDSLA